MALFSCVWPAFVDGAGGGGGRGSDHAGSTRCLGPTAAHGTAVAPWGSLPLRATAEAAHADLAPIERPLKWVRCNTSDVQCHRVLWVSERGHDLRQAGLGEGAGGAFGRLPPLHTANPQEVLDCTRSKAHACQQEWPGGGRGKHAGNGCAEDVLQNRTIRATPSASGRGGRDVPAPRGNPSLSGGGGCGAPSSEREKNPPGGQNDSKISPPPRFRKGYRCRVDLHMCTMMQNHCIMCTHGIPKMEKIPKGSKNR